MADLIAKEYVKFEDIKHIDESGAEFWLARELATCLEYVQWRNFNGVIDRAMLSCKNSGFEVEENFFKIDKVIEMPSKPHKNDDKIGFAEVSKTKIIPDYRLTRYACYLIVQNGDPRKEIIALGQTYFAIQTRRQEVQDYFNQLDEDNKRLVIRGDVKQWNQMLAETAHRAGVIDDDEFATFQNAGYMGLYGGETVSDIHERKRLKSKEKILDFMNSSELAANLFRITLAEEKIRKDNLSGVDSVSDAHMEVGKNVREAIKKSHGTLPEDQPTPNSSITEIERQQIRALKGKKKMLDE